MILGIFFCFLNIPLLTAFDTAAKHQDPIVQLRDDVDPKTRPAVNDKLNNPIADCVKISKVSRRSQSIQPAKDLTAALMVQRGQPFFDRAAAFEGPIMLDRFRPA